MIHLYHDRTCTRTRCGHTGVKAVLGVNEAEVRHLADERVCSVCLDLAFEERCILWTWHVREQLDWT